MNDSHGNQRQPAGLIVCALFTFASIACAGVYSGGSGTAEDPYQISTVADWQELIANSGDWDKQFILINDIDFGGRNLIPIAPIKRTDVWNGRGVPFSGTLDGNGHILSNLIMDGTDIDCIGLFGYLGPGGQILHLGIENATIVAEYHVGGLVGVNRGTIDSCYAADTVSVSWVCGAGGLVGMNFGTIRSCYATAVVNGPEEIGGLVGENYQGSITACYAAGTVTGSEDYYIGGLVGIFWGGTIKACFWDLETTGQAGGAVGKGLTTEQMKTLSIYQNAGWADKGWVIQDGVDYPRLTWEETNGTAFPPAVIPFAGSGTADDPYVISMAAEFAALSWYSGVLDRYILLNKDLDLSGLALYPIGDLGPFTGVFDGKGHILGHIVIQQPGSDRVGVFSVVAAGGQIRNLGVEHVMITGQSVVGGLVGHLYQGTLTGCYATSTVSGTVQDSGDPYYDYIGSAVGGLVGANGYGTITGCYASGTISGSRSVGGLVGSNGGAISACDSACTVVGIAGIGGLVGDNYEGTMTTCSATGTVNGDYIVGGLVGQIMVGTVSFCSTTCCISGSSMVGGLVGENGSSTIMDCYASGSVNGTSYVGGLVGFNFPSTIMACYATGSVNGTSDAGGLVGHNDNGSITASFWDKQTTGQIASSGGEGKMTEEMKVLSTFTDAGWDFVGEGANGTGDVWRMCADGIAYPRLSWEFLRGGDMDCPDGVAMEDLLYLAGRWMMETPEMVGAADADGSGKVDLNDLEILASNWMGM